MGVWGFSLSLLHSSSPPSVFYSFSHSILSSFPLVVKSMTRLTLNMSEGLAFNVLSKLYLSSRAVTRVRLLTAEMPRERPVLLLCGRFQSVRATQQ